MKRKTQKTTRNRGVLSASFVGKNLKRNIVRLFAIFLVVGCTTQTETNDANSSPFVAGGKYDQALSKELEAFKKEEDSLRKINAENLTDITFEVREFDFGKVKIQSHNEHYFVFTNTGDKPLVVENVQASCGCTTPEKPEKPIMPGEKDSIKVHFVPFQGMAGAIEKTVSIKSNTFTSVNQLFIRAFVEQ